MDIFQLVEQMPRGTIRSRLKSALQHNLGHGWNSTKIPFERFRGVPLKDIHLPAFFYKFLRVKNVGKKQLLALQEEFGKNGFESDFEFFELALQTGGLPPTSAQLVRLGKEPPQIPRIYDVRVVRK